MPLWARCSVGVINTIDQEGDSQGGEREGEDTGGRAGGGSTFEGIVRNVASLLSDKVFGYFRPAQKANESSTELSPSDQQETNPLPKTLVPGLSDTVHKEEASCMKADTLSSEITEATAPDGAVDTQTAVEAGHSTHSRSNEESAAKVSNLNVLCSVLSWCVLPHYC